MLPLLMPRVISFIVLIAIVLLATAFFFQVMVQFILPLFLAAVIVVIFRPLHEWMVGKCGDHPRIAAGLTTLAILFVVLLPFCGMLWNAYSEGTQIVIQFKELPSDQLWESVQQRAEKPVTWLEEIGFDRVKQQELLNSGIEKLRELALPLVLGGMRLVFGIVVSVAIMVLAVYYFFADGPIMIRTIMRLSPLDDRYELQLLDQFGRISRSVVVATLLSAFVQGLLAGVGYYFAGIGPVFFMTGLTMLLAIVPFVGAASVWIPTCLWIFLFGTGDLFSAGRPTAAIVLAIYCATIVSLADNIIKPFVLHGRSNLHPLVALLSILGGAQVLGPIGILVGPMLVAFLQALLEMLQREMATFDRNVEGTSKSLTSQSVTAPTDMAKPPTDQQQSSKPEPLARSVAGSRKRRGGQRKRKRS